MNNFVDMKKTKGVLGENIQIKIQNKIHLKQ